eukprot:Selendium_serpulae@DN3752_c0_g1_i2.p1
MAAVRIPFNRACTWGSMTEFENRTSENVDARNLNAEHARRTLLDLDLELKYTRRENVSRNVEPGAKYWHQVAQEHAKNLKSTYELAKADYHRRHASRFLRRHQQLSQRGSTVTDSQWAPLGRGRSGSGVSGRSGSGVSGRSGSGV